MQRPSDGPTAAVGDNIRTLSARCGCGAVVVLRRSQRPMMDTLRRAGGETEPICARCLERLLSGLPPLVPESPF